MCLSSKSEFVKRGSGLATEKCHLLASTEGPLIRTVTWLTHCHLPEWTCSQGAAPGEEGRDRQMHKQRQGANEQQHEKKEGVEDSQTVQHSWMQCCSVTGKISESPVRGN